MPVSSFSGLNLALSGLMANQRALDITGHNIANAGTVGYTRQEAVLAASPSLTVPQGTYESGAGIQLGQGVDLKSIRRIRDQFLDLQVRAQNLSLGQDSVTSDALSRVEDILQEPGDNGLNALLGKFWSAWQDLASHPESAAAKEAVAGQAATLADAFNTLAGRMDSIAADATNGAAQIVAVGGPVDQIAKELGVLNDAISRAVAAGTQPNDQLDRRDVLLDQLSKLGRVSVADLGGGVIEVSFGGAATPIVSGPTVTWPQALSSPGGQIGGLQDVAAKITGYRAGLDQVASDLASTVNALHPTPVFSGATAGALTAVVTPATVRATSAVNAGANDVAKAIAGLRGGLAERGYNDLVSRIGGDAATARAGEATATAVLNQLEERRQEVAGVSLDEELTNMMRFQRGYQAASRVMTTMDETLDALINRTGRVGL
ncbi:flagellar hook-associated protein FlgK [Conexibacter sp. SYSU D00693]|uniref:flagellar hook-associated protein FlgK n=1 Tax=Conexibacter sp. SYSU D00693 TaxID=2812560 RepID=UPI00196AFCDD|nr:flagellar hook-associated protein FlgK [Conexibacter sp. SYSU D00693]